MAIIKWKKKGSATMKQDSLRAIIIAVAALVMYNIAVFLIPFARTAVFWISWVFTLGSFIVVGASVYIAFVQNPDARNRFYGFPVARLGVIYGVMQLVLSFVFMALGAIIPWWIAVVVYALGLGLALIGLMTSEAALKEIQKQDKKQKKDVSVMRTILSKANQLPDICENAAAAAALKTFAEELRYSDPVSSKGIAAAEAELVSLVDQLQEAVVDGSAEEIQLLCRKASEALEERNRQCKLYKN